ncbi:MAG: tetratricopeptide repeat protein [Deltaproteobacteria bacterium]|nr:tetratricopeptide repeat protein [Deltaproteobacteria bacterium]
MLIPNLTPTLAGAPVRHPGARSRAGVLATLIGGALVLSGCASWTTTEKNDLLNEVSQLRRQVRSLQGPTSGGGGIREQLADINNRTSNLEGKVAQLGGVDEDLSHRLSQVEGNVAPPMDGGPGSPYGSTPPGSSYPGPVGSTGGISPPFSTQNSFDGAMRAYKEGRYRESVTFFDTFTRENPRSDRLEDAYFYKGLSQFSEAETSRDEKGYEEAILTFDKLRHDYPRSKFLPASLLKQGLAFKALGWPSEAKVFLNDVVQRYPNSPEASQAREQLKAL